MARAKLTLTQRRTRAAGKWASELGWAEHAIAGGNRRGAKTALRAAGQYQGQLKRLGVSPRTALWKRTMSMAGVRKGFGDFESKHPRGYGGKFRRK